MNSHRFFETHYETRGDDRWAVVLFHPATEADFGLELRQQIDKLLEFGLRSFEVDLRAVNVCNSVTLGVFVGLQNRVQKCHGKITFILRRDTHIRKMFTTLMLDRLLHIEEVATSLREQLPPEEAEKPRVSCPADFITPLPRKIHTDRGRVLEIRDPLDSSKRSSGPDDVL